MILEQHYLACLAQASYLIVDEKTKVAAVVDPRRDVDVYLDRARELGATIEHVLLTHFHADFLAGHLELAEKTGATIYLGAKASAEYEFQALAEGGRIAFGDVRIEALETPGHTPEGICLLVYDLEESAEKPHAVLTGDTLFIGDVGRPDLMASVGVTAAELAGMMYDSLHDKLLELPDETIVYPGHGAGSACGKNLSSETSSTIGKQRLTNYALQDMPKATFVEILTANQPVAPAYFPAAARKNRERRSMLEEVVSGALNPMTLAELDAAERAGALVLDIRHKDDFAAGHLSGSVSIGLDGNFASWAGTVLDLERSIVIVADPGSESEAVTRLGRIGLERVIGFLSGGAGAFAEHPERVARVERRDVNELARELEGASVPTVLDVRAPGEYEAGHIAGSLSVPLPELEKRLADVPGAGPLFVHCKSGYRSMTAASLLARNGYENVVDVAGGMDAWQAAGLPTVAVDPVSP